MYIAAKAGDEGVIMISEGLKSNTSLTSLVLWSINGKEIVFVTWNEKEEKHD